MHFKGRLSFLFFNDTATTEIYTLSLHDALPIFPQRGGSVLGRVSPQSSSISRSAGRSEEHTSELQSREKLGCRLLLEKKKEWPSGGSQEILKGPAAGHSGGGVEV